MQIRKVTRARDSEAEKARVRTNGQGAESELRESFQSPPREGAFVGTRPTCVLGTPSPGPAGLGLALELLALAGQHE
jgi:hypothetical protein